MPEYCRVVLEQALQGNVSSLLQKEIWIWGAGNTAVLYQEGFARLKEEGFCITGYCDSNSEKWDTELNGLPIVNPEKLKEKHNAYVLICTIRPEVIYDIRQRLNTLSLKGCLLDEVVLKWHREEVLQCYDSLFDENSKRVFAHLILCRLTGKNPDKEMISENQYFDLDRFRKSDKEEVFIDCGAYIGDTLEQYIHFKKSNFGKYIAFEPDKKSFSELEKIVRKVEEKGEVPENSIKIYPYGIGEVSTQGVFQCYEADNGLGSKFVSASNGEECKVVSLDEFITEPYTFLKADIESFEYKMILGAKAGIKKYRPKIAVCIYHNIVDMYAILLLLQSYVPEYHFAVRHYSENLAETVLYAWAEE